MSLWVHRRPRLPKKETANPPATRKGRLPTKRTRRRAIPAAGNRAALAAKTQTILRKDAENSFFSQRSLYKATVGVKRFTPTVGYCWVEFCLLISRGISIGIVGTICIDTIIIIAINVDSLRFVTNSNCTTGLRTGLFNSSSNTRNGARTFCRFN